MPDDRLRDVLTERYGRPAALAAERTAPPPPPPPAVHNDARLRRRRALDSAMRPATSPA